MEVFEMIRIVLITIFTAIVVLIIYTLTPAATLTIGTISSLPGEIMVPITFTVDNDEEVVALTVDIIHENLDCIDIYSGEMIINAEKDLYSTELENNKLRISILGFNQNLLTEGDLFSLVFEISLPGIYILSSDFVAGSSPQAASINIKVEDGGIFVVDPNSIDVDIDTDHDTDPKPEPVMVNPNCLIIDNTTNVTHKGCFLTSLK